MSLNSKLPQIDATQQAHTTSHESESANLYAKITELEIQIADRNEYIVQLLNRTPTTDTKLRDSKEPLIRDPEIFKAEVKNVKDTKKNQEVFLAFTSQVELKMTVDKDCFLTEKERILYVASRVSGPVYKCIESWVTPLIRNQEGGFKKWQDILEVLGRIYGVSDRHAAAEREMAALYQKNSTFAQFLGQFNTLLADLSWNDSAKVSALKARINYELSQALIPVIQTPEHNDYNGWVTLLVKLAENVEAYLQRKHLCPTNRWQARPLECDKAFRIEGLAKPIQLDTVRLQPAERARRVQCNLCLYCGKSGHFKDQCTEAAVARGRGKGIQRHYKTQSYRRYQKPAVGIQNGYHAASWETASVAPKPFLYIKAASIEGVVEPNKSFLLHIQVWSPKLQREISCMALVDTGASAKAFIDISFAYMHGLFTQRLRRPRMLQLADGSPTPAGAVNEQAILDFRLFKHSERASGFLTKLNSAVPIILGLEWLRLHDPIISFAKNTITFNSDFCHKSCLEDSHLMTVTGLTKEDEQTLQQSSLAQAHITRPSPERIAMDNTPSGKSMETSPAKDVLLSQDDEEQPPNPETVPNAPLSQNKKKKAPRLPARVVGGVRLPYKRRNHHPRPLSNEKLSDSEDQKSPEILDIRFVGAAPFAHLAKQKGTQVHRIDPRHLNLHKAPADQDFLALNGLSEEDFKNVLQGKATDKDRANFPDCFRNFINDYESKLFLNKITEEDIDKFLKVKEPMSKEEILKKLPPEYHEFVEVFLPKEANELPPHRAFDHKIELKPGEEPPYYRNRPMSARELEVVKKYLDDHLQKGFIRTSTSPAAAPILLAKKPGGGIRVCVDYRGLNALTAKNRYPIPLIRETLDALCNAKYYTKLDIIAAFNRLRMAEGEEWKTAFLTRYGLFEYLVMPFGLQNAPATFQHFINSVLHDFLDRFASAYLDDIIIYSKSKKEHREHVRKVLLALQKTGLQIDINKCEFTVQETKYLGLIITSNGIKMDPQKVKAILDWELPTGIKDLQSFLGFANFYRRFIKGFSTIARPLTNMLKGTGPWLLPEEAKVAFENLKMAFTSAPILAYFDPKKKTVLEADASNWASGGVLSQYGEDGMLHPVAYFSAKHSPQECNYEIYDKELLAIIKTLEEWRPELEGIEEEFEIITDHKNLQHFMTTKLLNQRQVRWSEFLSRFNFRIVYRPGKLAVKPDALSRKAEDQPLSKTDRSDDRINHRYQQILKKHNISPGMAPAHISSLRIYALAVETTTDDLISACYSTNTSVQDMLAALKDDSIRYWPQHLRKELRIAMSECKVVENRIYYRDRLWIPDDAHLRLNIMTRTHSSAAGGHVGRRKTIDLVKRSYFWPGMTKDIDQFVRHCHLCTRSKVRKEARPGFLKPLQIPFRPWSDISIDYITGLPECEGGYKHILVVVDRLTKMRHFIPCVTLEADELAERFIAAVYSLHGLPENIVSDRGSQFVSMLWRALSRRLKIALKFSSAFHPQTNGQTENANAFLEQYLRIFTNFVQNDWVSWLPLAEFACNNQVNDSTGVSPFFANYGFHPRMGVEPSSPCPPHVSKAARTEFFNANSIADRFQRILDFAKSNMALAQEMQEHYANQSRAAASRYKIGDKVWLDTRNIKTERPAKKLDDKFKGPFTVTKVGTHTVTLDLPKSWKIFNTFHTSLVRLREGDPYPGQEEVNSRETPERDEGVVVLDTNTGEEHKEWRFERILDSRINRRTRRLQYKIQWANSKPTWQPCEDVKGCDSDIRDFHTQNPTKPGPPDWFTQPSSME